MELIVYDNANTDKTQEIVKSFSTDKRLKSYRTEQIVPVTDNWNNALKVSTGEYILMIGDDDYLLPEYFQTLDQIIEDHDEPDAISYSGYSFVYPGVLDGNEDSYYSEQHFVYGNDLINHEYVSEKTLKTIVFDMFKFRNRIPLNTLPHTWSRKLINKVPGQLFRPPYPDHFALNSLMLKANKWVFSNEKLYVLCVTPDSYGSYVFSDDNQEKAADYLGISDDFPELLPGNTLVNNMYVWLQLLRQNYPDELSETNISRIDYIKHQIHYWFSQYKHGSISRSGLYNRFSLLTSRDLINLLSVVLDRRSINAFIRLLSRKNSSKIDTFYYGPTPLQNVSNAHEFYEKIIR